LKRMDIFRARFLMRGQGGGNGAMIAGS